MSLYDLLRRIASEYSAASQENFSGHLLAGYIRQEAKQNIAPLLDGANLYIVGSAGKGRWAEVPWIAIYDKTETDGPQEGLYVVYLFSSEHEACLPISWARCIEAY